MLCLFVQRTSVLEHLSHYPLETLTRRLQPSRLETRTKESNIYASAWVANLDA